MKKIKALIIGLGNIGMGYDISTKNKNLIYSHAKALSLHKDFNLLGGIMGWEHKIVPPNI